ncbi:unnamed protein product [Linum tenue]|uniref:Dof zinc finger protein n=1 Tax=Linum tenue TaxID=586396 RepID=A0AAV0JN57_9ROSI|nr:unnamed protein product [Linum tenue]
MVFPSSVSAYLDPSNWQQQQQQQQAPHSLSQNRLGGNQVIFQHPDGGNYGGAGGGSLNGSAPGGGGGTIAKPNSMAERARQAKIPQPESALKCPRCESTNTKFCYFNNYSLTQPRHFCKTCRRYWTRGGALRSVPVGGGCRRNKRSKSTAAGRGGRSSSSSAAAAGGNRSKSPNNKTTTADHHHHILGRGSSSLIFPNTHHDHNINLGQLLAPHQLPLLPPLHHLGQLADYNNNNNSGSTCHVDSGSVGALNFSAGGMISPPADVAGGNNIVEQWRLQQQVHQFPFFANLEQQQPPPPTNTAGMSLYSSSIGHDEEINQGGKMEGHNGNNLLMSRNFLGNFSSPAVADRHHDEDENHNQQQRYCSGGGGGWQAGGGGGGGKYMNGSSLWSGGGGDGLPGFTSSSSTSHLL